jgi:hypothetical protein
MLPSSEETRIKLKSISQERLVGMLLDVICQLNRLAREIRFQGASEDSLDFRLRKAWDVEDLIHGIEFPELEIEGAVHVGELLPAMDHQIAWRAARQQRREDEGWDWSAQDEREQRRNAK